MLRRTATTAACGDCLCPPCVLTAMYMQPHPPNPAGALLGGGKGAAQALTAPVALAGVESSQRLRINQLLNTSGKMGRGAGAAGAGRGTLPGEGLLAVPCKAGAARMSSWEQELSWAGGAVAGRLARRGALTISHRCWWPVLRLRRGNCRCLFSCAGNALGVLGLLFASFESFAGYMTNGQVPDEVSKNAAAGRACYSEQHAIKSLSGPQLLCWSACLCRAAPPTHVWRIGSGQPASSVPRTSILRLLLPIIAGQHACSRRGHRHAVSLGARPTAGSCSHSGGHRRRRAAAGRPQVHQPRPLSGLCCAAPPRQLAAAACSPHQAGADLSACLACFCSTSRLLTCSAMPPSLLDGQRLGGIDSILPCPSVHPFGPAKRTHLV